MLNELRNHALLGDEIGHGHMRDFNHALGNSIRERRDAIDDDKRVADEGGFNGGGAAGDDGGAGVEESSAGFLYEVDGKALGVLFDDALDGSALRSSESGASGMRNS